MLKLKEMRIRKNITQSELSILSGVSRSYISELENNDHTATVYIICKLCKALKITPNELIKEEYYK